MKDSTKILITTYIPTLNKGMLGLLKGILKTFDALGQTEVTVFSFYPEFDGKRYPPNVKLIDVGKDLHIATFFSKRSANFRLIASIAAAIQHLLFALLYSIFKKKVFHFFKSPIWHEYYSSDALIVCTSEDDCVNGSGTFLWLSPVYLSLLAKVLRKPVVVYANSTTKTGNLVWLWRLKSRRLWEILAKYSLNNCDLITVRDRETFRYYKNFLNEKQIFLTGDPGVLLDSAEPTQIESIMSKEKARANNGYLIGATITQRLLLHSFPECFDTREKYEKVIAEVAKVFDRITTIYPSKIIFLPHCTGFLRNNDDRVVARDIVEKMHNKSHATVINNEYTPEALKGIISFCDFFIGDRIHALISALSMNVPCCIFAYSSDRRPYNLIGQDFKQEKWIFEFDTFNTSNLIKLLTELISSSEEIRRNLPPIVESVKEKALLNGSLLRALLHSALADSY